MAKFEQIAGSPPVRVTTRADVKRAELHREITVNPIEGTQMSLFHSIIPSFWAENGLSGGFVFGNAALAERVWVANRCIQLNAQQIASMPLHYHSNAPGGGREPAWVSAPDPNLFPNGIGDALHAMVAQIYGWGFSCQFITSFYEDFYPRTWTVLNSEFMNIKFDEQGQREYRYGEGEPLDPRRIIQIDRNPTTAPHGTSAIRAHAQLAYGLMAAGNQSMSVNNGAIPAAILKSQRKLTAEQAEGIADKWDEASAARAGVRVLPPELDYEAIQINPADLALLDTQEWNAKALMTAFGIPATLMNMSIDGGLTYNNPALLGEQWWRFELRPMANRIANAFSAQALPRGNWVDFDATDTILPVELISAEDDIQLSQVAQASPAQQPRPLTAIGGTG